MSEEDKMLHAKQQAQAQFESIKEMVADLDDDARKETIDELQGEIDEAYDEYVEAKKEIGEEPFDSDDWLEIEKTNKSPIAEKAAEIERLEEVDSDEARQTIQEDALSVQVRSGWYSPGEKPEPYEFEILLCTGGPAVRIIGRLGEHNEPDDARLECQDWFTPWTDYMPHVSGIEGDVAPDWRETLLAYARCFYFGE